MNSRARLLCLATICLVLLLNPTHDSAGETNRMRPSVAYPKDSHKPDLPAAALRGVPLDCTSAQNYVIDNDQTVTTVSGQTSSASQTNGYSCVGWLERGGEFILTLDISTKLLLHVTLDSSDDLDLFLLSDCHSDSCLFESNREFIAETNAGTYVLVVDSDLTGERQFSLELEGLPIGAPMAACDVAKPLACVEAGSDTIRGNVFGQDSLVVYADCSPILEYGSERWHRLDLPAGATLEATLLMLGADGAMWLFEDCGPTATCVAFTDQTGIGSPEVLNFSNSAGQESSYYLAVDTFRPTTNTTAGEFALTIDCTGVSPPGHIPSAVAESAEAVLLGEITRVLTGNLFDQPNLLTTASCGGFSTGGGERWYALTLADDANFTVTLSDMDFDGALWLFDGCGPDASCVAFVDDHYERGNPWGHEELLVATKAPGGSHTYYLAVDTTHDTSIEPALYWNYTLTLEPGAKSLPRRSTQDVFQRIFR
jgi:hypothetical protein